MIEQNLDQLIKQSSHFITDLEEIVDIILAADQVFLYDTGSIASHERIYHSQEKNLLSYFKKDQDPIILTDTIARELKLTERNLSYLSQFTNVLYLHEKDFLNLIKIEIESRQATGKYVNASIGAFSDLIPLKQAIQELEHDPNSKMEYDVYEQFKMFFERIGNKNKGEISLLWCSLIIGIFSPKTPINFVSRDSDLYTFVSRCYMADPYVVTNKPKRFISLSSNETLLQSLYALQTLSDEEFWEYLTLYRDEPKRGIIYFEIRNGLKIQSRVQKHSFSNAELRDGLIHKNIEIVY